MVIDRTLRGAHAVQVLFGQPRRAAQASGARARLCKRGGRHRPRVPRVCRRVDRAPRRARAAGRARKAGTSPSFSSNASVTARSRRCAWPSAAPTLPTPRRGPADVHARLRGARRRGGRPPVRLLPAAACRRLTRPPANRGRCERAADRQRRDAAVHRASDDLQRRHQPRGGLCAGGATHAAADDGRGARAQRRGGC